jgi:transposase
LAAMMFSLLQTLTLWHINPRLWLTAYLEACATAGGKAPPNLASYLPWNLTEERRKDWCWKEEEAVATDTS